VKERPSLPRRESRGLRLTPLVVQSSDSRWTAAPHRHQIPDQISRPDRPNAIGPAVPPKDDLVGWPEELLIDFPDSPDCASTKKLEHPALGLDFVRMRLGAHVVVSHSLPKDGHWCRNVVGSPALDHSCGTPHPRRVKDFQILRRWHGKCRFPLGTRADS
jgi:hypothetical protein